MTTKTETKPDPDLMMLGKIRSELKLGVGTIVWASSERLLPKADVVEGGTSFWRRSSLAKFEALFSDPTIVALMSPIARAGLVDFKAAIPTPAPARPSTPLSISASHPFDPIRAEIKNQVMNHIHAHNAQQSQIEALEAEGKFEEAYALLPASEKSKYMGAKTYAAYRRNGGAIKIYGPDRGSTHSSRDQ